jgi:hypothetical protein
LSTSTHTWSSPVAILSLMSFIAFSTSLWKGLSHLHLLPLKV